MPVLANAKHEAVALAYLANNADDSKRAVVSTVRANTLKNHRGPAADGADANITHCSGLGNCRGTGCKARL
jgi:hypothetical protein